MLDREGGLWFAAAVLAGGFIVAHSVRGIRLRRLTVWERGGRLRRFEGRAAVKEGAYQIFLGVAVVAIAALCWLIKTWWVS